ncbi:MAG: Lpg1974 family pore-forming outer membrane protein, partial [Chlamydiota bacterium]|nr:Lpg1974 family pore-forming outer membrane protein [Chlamydiota bacterium]
APLSFNSPIGVSLDGDFLYWKSNVNGLVYGYSASESGLIPRKHLLLMEAPHALGFRTGITWDVEEVNWNLCLKYTWFYDSSEVAEIPSTTLTPLFSFLNIGKVSSNETSLRTSWNIHHQVGDLSLLRVFSVGKRFSFSPFFGFRGAWQKEKCEVEYDYQVVADIFQGIHIKLQNRYGLGLRGGAEATWKLSRFINLYGVASHSLLWFHNRVTADSPQPTSSSARKGYSYIGNITGLRPVIDCEVGICWHQEIRKGGSIFTIKGAWEGQSWIGNSQYIQPQSGDIIPFDLTIQGAKASIGISF